MPPTLLDVLPPDVPAPAPGGFCLWYKPSADRTPSWQLVARCATEAEAVDAIGVGGRRGGRWLILPAGREP